MYREGEPIYQQVAQIIRSNIESGKWPVHTKLPEEIVLSQQLGISRGTLRRALKDLIDQGVLTQIRGRGTFVVSNTLEQHLASKLISFAESMKQQGLRYKTVVLKQEIAAADMKVAAYLELEKNEQVSIIERVRLVQNNPVIYLRNIIPEKVCPGFAENDFENQDIFSLLERKYGQKIQWGRRYFKAVPAWGEVSQNLGLAPGTPVLYLEQIIYDAKSRPLECSSVWINSERFDIVSILER